MADTPAAAAVAAVTNATEQQPTATAPAAAAPEDASSKAFAVKERQLHAQRKQLMQEKAELQAKIAEYETGYVPKSRFKDDPFGALEESGASLEKLTEQLMNQPQDPATRAMLAKIKDLENKFQQTQTKAAEAQQAQYNQALKQIGDEVKMTVAADDRFETVRAKGMEDAVLELIKETFDADGTLLDVEDAAQQIEDYLIEEGMSFASLKKVQAKLQPKETAEVTGQATAQSQIRTLSNDMQTKEPKKSLTSKERIERAKLAFAGKLQS